MSIKPSIGRIVHYTTFGAIDELEVRAAIITGVNDDGTVSLQVFGRLEQYIIAAVEYTSALPGDTRARGKWAWPAREAQL